MSGFFGDSGAKETAARQAATARQQTQTSNEEANREQQRGERGGGSGGSAGRGRNMLVGRLSSALKNTLGG